MPVWRGACPWSISFTSGFLKMRKIIDSGIMLASIIVFSALGFYFTLTIGVTVGLSVAIGLTIGSLFGLLMLRVGFRALWIPAGGCAFGLLGVFLAQFLFGGIAIFYFFFVSAFVVCAVTLSFSVLLLSSTSLRTRLFGAANPKGVAD
jgi:hypothetical protein